MINRDGILIDLVEDVRVETKVSMIYKLSETITEWLPFTGWNHHFNWLIADRSHLLLGPCDILT